MKAISSTFFEFDVAAIRLHVHGVLHIERPCFDVVTDPGNAFKYVNRARFTAA